MSWYWLYFIAISIDIHFSIAGHVWVWAICHVRSASHETYGHQLCEQTPQMDQARRGSVIYTEFTHILTEISLGYEISAHMCDKWRYGTTIWYQYGVRKWISVVGLQLKEVAFFWSWF